jgi:hypothetical protein
MTGRGHDGRRSGRGAGAGVERRIIMGLLAVVLASGCGREQRSINVTGSASLIRGNGAAESVRLEGRVYDVEMPADAFADAWAVVSREAAPYPAMMLTVGSAWDVVAERTDLVAGLILAVPTPLRAGAVYAIDHTFPPPIS